MATAMGGTVSVIGAMARGAAMAMATAAHTAAATAAATAAHAAEPPQAGQDSEGRVGAPA